MQAGFWFACLLALAYATNMFSRKRTYLVGALLVGAIAVGAMYTASNRAIAPSTQTSTKMRITASFYPLYFFTKEIAGDDADVQNLTPAGAEPHEYEPTPQEIIRLEESQIVIVNGAMEPWLGKIKQSLSDKGIVLVTTGEGLFSRQEKNGDSHAVQDVHVWLSPRIAKHIVERIRDALSNKDPQHATRYHARTEDLIRRLTELDAQFTQGLRGCTQTSFITSHAAFGYLADEYGLTQIGIAGLSPEAEPSPQALGEIADVAKTHKIKYIFFETLVDPRLANTLAEEVGAQTLVLNPLEGMSDQDIAKGKTYFTEMQQNLAHLRLALTCPVLTQTP